MPRSDLVHDTPRFGGFEALRASLRLEVKVQADKVQYFQVKLAVSAQFGVFAVETLSIRRYLRFNFHGGT